jgi:uncharacterized BrkB/YihY/UPF0761 family membrane protein
MSDFDDESYLTGDDSAPVSRDRERRLEPDRSVLILVFGILGLVFCLIFGILAWVWGNQDLAKMRAGRMDDHTQGTVQAGRVLGMISVILTVGVFVVFVLLAVVGGVSSSSSGY